MRKNMTRFVLALCLVVSASVLAAELGLSQMLSGEGVVAVGQAVKDAVAKIYSSTDDPEVIKRQITAIMDEAAATGDGEAVRYAIVGAMDAGGAENLDLTIAAINASKAFSDFKEVTQFTVSSSKTIILANAKKNGSGNKEQGGGKEQGGAKEEQGGDKEEQGGGDQDGGMEQGGGSDYNPLDDGDDADIEDNDIPGTPV